MLLRSIPPHVKRVRAINSVINELETLRNDIDPSYNVPPENLKPSYLELLNTLCDCVLMGLAVIFIIIFAVCLLL